VFLDDGSMTGRPDSPCRPALRRARWELLQWIEAIVDKPMIALSFVWLGLLVLDFTRGLSRPFEIAVYVIWALFVLHFALGIVIAPSKVHYLRRNWLTLVALILPAFRMLAVFRVFRLLRAAHAVRSLSLLRLVTSVNRGMRAVGNVLGRRGVGYVVALTAIVTLVGAAGMAQFESPAALQEAGFPGPGSASPGLADYGEALWWTAMLMTTMGSDYWPKTAEGRVLAWLLAVYAFAIFGYITAMIASVFIGRDAAAATEVSPPTGETSELATLREEIVALRSQVGTLTALLAPPLRQDRRPAAERPRQSALRQGAPHLDPGSGRAISNESRASAVGSAERLQPDARRQRRAS
jgi:voltage-gated potassium channel